MEKRDEKSVREEEEGGMKERGYKVQPNQHNHHRPCVSFDVGASEAMTTIRDGSIEQHQQDNEINDASQIRSAVSLSASMVSRVPNGETEERTRRMATGCLPETQRTQVGSPGAIALVEVKAGNHGGRIDFFLQRLSFSPLLSHLAVFAEQVFQIAGFSLGGKAVHKEVVSRVDRFDVCIVAARAVMVSCVNEL